MAGEEGVIHYELCSERAAMPPKRRYLPSLGSLATFEVAAKHLSFTLAGTELNITQGAISQQIRGLEKALDVTLFVRKHNSLELTPRGARRRAPATERGGIFPPSTPSALG